MVRKKLVKHSQGQFIWVLKKNKNRKKYLSLFLTLSFGIILSLIAASERSERAATLIWPSRTGHLYIAVPYSTFPGSRYFLL